MASEREELNRLRQLALRQELQSLRALAGPQESPETQSVRSELQQLQQRQAQGEQGLDARIAELVGQAGIPAPQTAPSPVPQRPEGFPGASVIEPAATVISGAIAEPLAGLAGIGQAINPFAEPGAGAEAVEATREALTFVPRTQKGQEGLQAVGEFLSPVGEVIQGAEQTLGESTLEATGSPALAAAAHTIPTALLEVLGLKAGKTLAKANQKTKAALNQGKIARSINEAVPSINDLKSTSRAIFKEIDDLGVSMQPKAYQGLVNRLNTSTKNLGINQTATPKAFAALQEFQAKLGQSPSLGDIDIARKVAQGVARSADPQEAALGATMINTVDNFLDQLGPSAFKRGTAEAGEIGKRYRAARQLWGRARKGELMEQAFTNADLHRAGFESGIAAEFKRILKNQKLRKFFSQEEIKLMNRVAQPKGSKAVNLAKLIGKFGFSGEGMGRSLVPLLGGAGGAAVFGPAGATVMPVIGMVGRELADKLVARNAKFADQVIRAGSDAQKIVKAYMKNTPKKLRDADELSQLLIRENIDLTDIGADDLSRQAAQLANQKRAALAGVLAESPEENEQ